jgi:hypothetical protein
VLGFKRGGIRGQWHFTSEARERAVTQNLNGIADLPPERRRLWNFVLWPNFMANVYPGAGNVSTNLLIPIAPDHTLAVYDFYFAEDAPEDSQRANVEFIEEVQQEDIVLCESVQRGLSSGRFGRGRLSQSECFIDRFAWQVARELEGEAIKPPAMGSAHVKF